MPEKKKVAPGAGAGGTVPAAKVSLALLEVARGRRGHICLVLW